MVIQEKDQVQLKIVKQQYRGSVKRASDMKMKVELYRVSILMFVLPKKLPCTLRIDVCIYHAESGVRERKRSFFSGVPSPVDGTYIIK